MPVKSFALLSAMAPPAVKALVPPTLIVPKSPMAVPAVKDRLPATVDVPLKITVSASVPIKLLAPMISRFVTVMFRPCAPPRLPMAPAASSLSVPPENAAPTSSSSLMVEPVTMVSV